MCGIAGILGYIDPSDESRVAAMNAVQRHRGPDSMVVKSYPAAVLGHTRLSIIDLTDQALQPMESPDGRFTLVYNGEIYNFKELRRDLEAGYNFLGTGDTEVLLAAWIRWGEQCLEYLNGMFAFCIYDVVERKAFFARDRFGQKPFYFTEEIGRLLFASEVKALLAAGITSRPDMDTWSRYLVSASYDDDSATFFAGITQLQPGECATWSRDGGIQVRKYYRLLDRVTPRNLDVATAARETRELLVDASRIHMRADVPVAVSLSGGLDSSALLACLDLASELNEDVACLSVEFESDLSERDWIAAAAKHHRLPYRIHTYNPDEFRSSIGPMIWQSEGPLGGLMNCALGGVMEMAHESGFRVLQDGSGLDEAFGGYRNHHNQYLGLLLRHQETEAARAIRDYAVNWGVDESTARAAAMAELANVNTAIDGSAPVRCDLLNLSVVDRVQELREPRPTTAGELWMSLADYLQVRKIPRNARMKDRMSMAYGLELRLPFLDHRLVEFALSLPSAHYFLHGRSKSIVREGLAGAMDDTVRTATKRSIQAPQGKWLMREPMRTYVQELLDSQSFADRGLFDVPAAKTAFREFCTGAYDNSFFVWQWINVEEWHRTFIDGNPIAEPNPLCRELWDYGRERQGVVH